MTLERIRRCLSGYQPSRVERERVARAAVAMVLRDGGQGSELLLIRRATRDNDPWSGHIAFPGGRRDPDDRDLSHTAVRETCEEVGIDLAAHGEVLGTLDDLQAVGRGRPLDLIISPFVYALKQSVEPSVNQNEVESAVWIPLRVLRSEQSRTTYRRSLDGTEAEFPAYAYKSYVVWGLTYRILERFFELLDRDIAGAAAPG
jgi:8-oxo-dGTP pyrophosphatase MutT (NUDIX family)